ncbi:P-loop containing nucleoside triphosphate hydrolase protein [Periconia macrospinosa]|uniref:P-loop containing nucleoside triphosphate hydrolase protein n=1 Tax=Periconia macrospinosa TaxID=97972 RepID=A0A2V1CZK7_9PLEO|nr:P-loop containing nucleoside triphosphate hydrolase protein [Periconia macrospinosa]
MTSLGNSSKQKLLLDLFFPGLAPTTSSLWPLLTDLPTDYGGLLCICGLLLFFGKYASEYLGTLLETYFTSKIEVSYRDEAYDMLISWHEEDRWKSPRSRSKRDTATVVIKKEMKKMLLDDMAEFLDPQTRTWYCMRSLPYQRGYLFYGLPGTGKSSFSLSIAGRFDLDLYVLSIPSLSDRSLKTLFADLPQQCIVLLEDVDAVGLKREQDANTDASQGGIPRKSANKVSLSTLLNVLDGIGSSEGRVLIMTTNHIERLDPALIRPGRADMKVEFQLADRDMISQLFFFIYGPKPSNEIDYNESGSSISQGEKDYVIQNGELHQLAQEFAAKIPESEFSPAEIMSFLLANKHSPRRAVAGVGDWMERNREERKRAPRTNSWALAVNDEFDDP